MSDLPEDPPVPSRGIPVMAVEGEDQEVLERLAGSRPGPGGSELSVVQLEALLFVAERPLARREIARLAGVDPEAVDARLGDLEVALRGRGVRLVTAGEQVELATAPEAGELIARYVGTADLRLSPAALETLAIVAYRQPVTRGTIERIRGVDSDYVVRSLLHRRLVVELGRSPTPGRPILYGTGFEFLERFGLTSLEDLPPLEGEVAARLAADDSASDPATSLTEATIDGASDTLAEEGGRGPSGVDDARPSGRADPDADTLTDPADG